MASRMDRYYQNSNHVARSVKNKDLYKQVQNINTSDMNNLKTITNVNELDISKINNLTNSRENYKREKRVRQAISNSNIKLNIPVEENYKDLEYDILDVKPQKVEEVKEKDVKNYDVVDILTKAKDDRCDVDNKNRNLKDLDYEDLNKLNLHKKEYKDSEDELKDLIQNINNASSKDDVGLLDDLKESPIKEDSSPIKKVIEQDIAEKRKDDTQELDKSFFTSKYDFKDEDFDELLLKKNKKKKEIIIFTIISLVVVITILVVFALRVFNF